MNQPPFFIPPLVQGNLLKEINGKLDKIISKKSSYTQEDDNLYML